MKCPKCGYTSFDYLDACKKCGTDLSAVRAMLGVIAVAPDDMAVASPRGPTGAAAAAALASATLVEDFDDINFGIEPTNVATQMQEEEEEQIDLGSFVEPTHYGKAGENLSEPPPKTEPPPQAASKPQAAKAEEDDEFLDLDFGGIFEDDEKKQ